MVVVAQPGFRVADCESAGRGFESRQSPQKFSSDPYGSDHGLLLSFTR